MTGRRVAKAPCKSCPYRRDVPSGVWHKREYDKLPDYDGEIGEQLAKGAVALFDCHQRDNNLCAGWIGTHGAHELLAMRLHHAKIDPSVWRYKSPVPVFASGQEACDHGKREIKQPGVKARRMVTRLLRTVTRKPKPKGPT